MRTRLIADATRGTAYNPHRSANTLQPHDRCATTSDLRPPMFCPACSAESSADSVFCPKCGHRMADPAPAGAKTPVERLRGNGVTNSEPEQQLWHGSYSPKAMYGQWLLAIVITLVALVVAVLFSATVFVPIAAVAIVVIVWLCLAASYLYQRLSVDYMLTTQRFVHQAGFLRRVINR